MTSAIRVESRESEGFVEKAMFKAALPYGIASLTMGVAAITLLETTAAKAMAMYGIMMPVMAAAMFVAVVYSILSCGSVEHFKEVVFSRMIIAAGLSIAIPLFYR